MPKNSNTSAKDLREFKASLDEGVKYAKGQKAKVKVETIYLRTQPQEVKEARRALHVTQPQFAKLLDVSPETVRKWEQGVNPVPGLASRWVEAALRRPKMVKSLLQELTEAKSMSRGADARHEAPEPSVAPLRELTALPFQMRRELLNTIGRSISGHLKKKGITESKLLRNFEIWNKAHRAASR